jgi:phosphatidylinositol alpha-mannosyltransferase
MRAARHLWASLQFPFFQRGVAVSDAAARYASETWKRPLSVVPNGIRTDLFLPPEHRPPDREAPLRLLFVGRLGDPRKGLRHLLTAYDQLCARGVHTTLDVVGELGGAAPPAPRPGLTYHGPLHLADLLLRYRACDVFVAPSTGQESFGIVLLEAMACGRPVVCSDIEGYRRTVDPLGALLLPPGDAEALAQALAELAGQPARRQKMGDVNRERARAFDWTAVSRCLRTIYAEAIESHAAVRGAGRALPPERGEKPLIVSDLFRSEHEAIQLTRADLL